MSIPARRNSRKIFDITMLMQVIEQRLWIKAIGIGDAAFAEVADSDDTNFGEKPFTQKSGFFCQNLCQSLADVPEAD